MLRSLTPLTMVSANLTVIIARLPKVFRAVEHLVTRLCRGGVAGQGSQTF